MAKNKNFTKKALAIGAVALVAGLGLGVAGVYTFDNPEPVVVYKEVSVPVEVQVPVETIVEVPVETIVEVPVETIVEVDNGDMEFVLTRLEEQGVIADAEEIVAELKAEDAALALAIEEIRNGDLFEMMEDAGLIVDDDEAFIKKISVDYEDVVVVNSDFDNNEYSFDIQVKVYDEDSEDYVYSTVFVEVIGDEAELISVI